MSLTMGEGGAQPFGAINAPVTRVETFSDFENRYRMAAGVTHEDAINEWNRMHGYGDANPLTGIVAYGGGMVNDRLQDAGDAAVKAFTSGQGTQPVLMSSTQAKTSMSMDTPTPGPLTAPAAGGAGPGGIVSGIVKAVGQAVVSGVTQWGINKVNEAFAPSQGGPPALPDRGGTLGQGGTGGVGGMGLPNAPASAGGIIYQPGKGMVLRTTVNVGTRTRDVKVRMNKAGFWELAPRHMNVLNPHALRRAFRRMQGFHHFAKGALQYFGFHVSGHPKATGHGKKRRRR